MWSGWRVWLHGDGWPFRQQLGVFPVSWWRCSSLLLSPHTVCEIRTLRWMWGPTCRTDSEMGNLLSFFERPLLWPQRTGTGRFPSLGLRSSHLSGSGEEPRGPEVHSAMARDDQGLELRSPRGSFVERVPGTRLFRPLTVVRRPDRPRISFFISEEIFWGCLFFCDLFFPWLFWKMKHTTVQMVMPMYLLFKINMNICEYFSYLFQTFFSWEIKFFSYESPVCLYWVQFPFPPFLELIPTINLLGIQLTFLYSLCVRVCICMCVCMYVHVNMYTYTQTLLCVILSDKTWVHCLHLFPTRPCFWDPSAFCGSCIREAWADY